MNSFDKDFERTYNSDTIPFISEENDAHLIRLHLAMIQIQLNVMKTRVGRLKNFDAASSLRGHNAPSFRHHYSLQLVGMEYTRKLLVNYAKLCLNRLDVLDSISGIDTVILEM